jgi:uncharacterized membrane protein
MTASAFRSFALVGATISMGLVAGVFDLYAHTVMPALKGTDDRTFVAAFQSLDRSIINPWFVGGSFLGALVLTAAATVANRGEPSFTWAVVALVAYTVAVIVTVAVHVPLNDAIKAAGDPQHLANLGLVRAQFDEHRWAMWNLVRALTATGAFASLTWALVQHGRSTA